MVVETKNAKKSDRMELFIVDDKENGKTYIPETISQNRNKTAIACNTIIISLFIFFVDAVCYRTSIYHQLGVLCCGVFSICLSELVYRVILFWEEKNHLTSRYGNNRNSIFRHIFTASWLPVLAFLITFIALLLLKFYMHPVDVSMGLNISVFYLLAKTMSLEQAPIYSSLQMEVDNGLSYGSGMAYSFFYGYLKKVLAKACNVDENLQEKIEKYCDTHSVSLTVSKLLMLIPKSGTCLRSLKDSRFPDIEESSSLSEKIESVGGVLDRVYKNSVYKIKNHKKQKKYYVCVEYASPLVTFEKGLESNGPHCEYYKLHREDIILQFYLTLKTLVQNDKEISQLCDLIYYDDKDEKGHLRDVAQIILTRVRALKHHSKKGQ